MGCSKQEMQAIMKNFLANSGTSSVNKQLELLDSIMPIAKSTDCPSEAITMIIHSLASWLDRSQYRPVSKSVSKLLGCLLATHPKAAMNALCSCLRKIAEYQQKNIVQSRSESARSLLAFSWSCLVAEQYFLCDDVHPIGADNPHWCSFAAVQVMLYNGACASMHRSITKSATRKLHQLSRKVEGNAYDVYHDTLMKSPADQGVCGFLGTLVLSDPEAFKKKKEDYLNAYVKLIVMSKTRPLRSLLDSCGPALKYISHEDFNTILVPGMQKALLRNPENVLPTICTILHEVAIDLSQHALTVTKSLTSQLSSKTDKCRDEAALAMAAMASQCSDAGAVEEVVEHLFGILKGSDGKLSMAGQKISVLDVIGKLSSCPVGGGQSSVTLSSTVTGLFVSILQQEIHEGTLVKALSALSGWCRKFTHEVPTSLIDLFNKGPGLKASTSAVRASYLECMICSFTRDSLEQANVFLPFLLQTVEKASGQTMQIPIVCEALSAAYLICKLVTTETNIGEAKLNAFWTTVLDTKKKIFTSDKFLQQATDSALLRLIALSECLLLEHPSKVQDEKTIQYCSVLVHQLLNKSWEIRKTAQKAVRKLLSSLSGSHFCSSLISQLSAILQPSKVIDLEKLDDTTEILKSYILPKRFENALNCFLRVPAIYSNKQTASSIALQLLPDCYHPCIRLINNHIWTDFLVNAKLDALEYIKQNLEVIIENYVKEISHTESDLSALGDLVRIAPHVIMPTVLEYVTKELSVPELVQVTAADYSIMNTPEGELWNKAIIESGPKIAENKNIKRENKLYSHKEQMEFLQLQKEIEAKKLRKGGGGGVKGLGGVSKGASQPLSKKQKELVEQELQKEAEIRKNLLMLKEKFQTLCSVLESCINQQNAFMLARYAPSLIELILPLLSSLLTSKSAQNLYVLLRKTVADDRLKNLGLGSDYWLTQGDGISLITCERRYHIFLLVVMHALPLTDIQVAYATLRLHAVAHPVAANWCEEDLKSCAVRIVSTLRTILKTGSFTSPCFSYIFSFFSSLLRDGGAKVNGDEEIMMLILESIQINVKAASQTVTEEEDGPRYLPRQGLLKSMRQLIGTSTYNIQNIACQVFVGTCKSAASMNPDLPEVAVEVEILLQCLLSPLEFLRRTALKGMICLVDYLYSSDVTPKRLWVAKFDSDEECKILAGELWIAVRLSTDVKLCQSLLEDITHHEPVVQQAAAIALHAALQKNPNATAPVLDLLVKTYNEKLHQPPAVLDSLGRVITEAPPDDFQSRIGIAMALRQISPVLCNDQIQSLFSFFVPDALKDRCPEVRSKMLSAALQAVNDHGKSCTSTLLDVFENFLKQAPNSESFDTVRQSVVILMGTLARHLEKTDPKVKPIVAKLTETLSTPSQPVQEAVANCLPPLVPAIKSDAPDIVKKMLLILLESENYGERKGAAYGLAGMVKGLGIIAFKQLEIMNTLTEAIQDKKNFRHREGALFAFEMFCTMLGRLFEPYIVHVLPHLLVCFGDGNQYVREAADDTARAVMKNLSAHGVKLVLPSLVSALEEDSWRTKTGSVELLGAMAFCAPKQLSSCLPSVVPRLCEVMTDSHPKVQRAGQQALKQIGSVIRNPEIQVITPILLDALSDPSRKTSKCLQTLLNTKFVHFIDAASLALIMPVVHRAFQDRSTDTRKMAAQIIGNMYSLTDQKDLNPYLSSLIPGLKTTLLDPVPEVRTVATKALGAMVRVTGESLFEQLLPWLMDTLITEQSSVDRSGAAQGLSEILAALGVGKLEKLLPDIIRMASSQDVLPHVRDGYIMMYIYLPSTFGDSFTPYIGDIIPALLKALADECEFLRETALTAGQRIITMYAQTAITLLLPQLESGLFDENWRIRLSSVQLLGDLLYHISGVTGKMSATGEEDDNFGTSAGHQTIMDVLGEVRRNRVFSGLYMGRSDVALLVRQSALHVWKIVVPNTPRVLREILPTLFQLLLGCLASSSYDKRQVAARTLGDIVRKLGERMLPEIIPILENGLDSEQSDQRQGVCIGLSEIIKSCSKDAILTFTDNLVPTVRRALEDQLPEVREAAALTFENLHNTIGSQALEDILPSLMKDLNNSSKAEYVVDGLKQVIAVKGRVVMPFIVPKLIQPPVNTHIIALLSSVAGEALTKHLSNILKALISALVASSSDDTMYDSTLEDCKVVILSVEGEHGTRIVLDDLMEATRSENDGTRKAAISLLHAFCQNTESDFSDYVAVFIRGFFKLLIDSDEGIQEKAWMALSAVTKTLDASEQLQTVSSIRQAIRFIRDDVKQCGGILPGFCLPKKGLTPVLPIFREGILNGSPDMKEQAAKGLGECIQIMTPLAIKPSVVNITGPLIRILGDRFSSNVRLAVLETLTILLEKAGAFLKPFLPQLQTTFSKALHDSSRAVRLQSAAALKHLVTVHPRLDPLFTDLNNNIKSSEDPLAKETLLHALRGCIIGGGSKMNSSLRNDIISTLSSALYSDEESCCRCAAGCLGSLCSIMPETDLENFLTHTVLVKEPDASWSLRQGRSAVLAVALKEAANRVYSGREETILNAVLDLSSMDRVQIVINGVHAAAYLMRYHINNNRDLPNKVVDALQKGFTHTSNDIKTETCNSVHWAVSVDDCFKEGEENGHHGSSLPQKTQIQLTSILISLTKEKNTTVRCSAESCLVALLSLRQSDEPMTVLLSQLSNRDVNSLMELQKTRFKKILSNSDVIGDIDDTLLTK